jgi:hypothetical protein
MINKVEAVKIAKQLTADNSWGWCEPAEVIFRRSWFGKPLFSLMRLGSVQN